MDKKFIGASFVVPVICMCILVLLVTAFTCEGKQVRRLDSKVAFKSKDKVYDNDATAGNGSPATSIPTIADYRMATENVLRSIPQSAIDLAKSKLRIYYFNTSHGMRVTMGMFGLSNYKPGDNAKYGLIGGNSPVSGKLWIPGEAYDLSSSERTWDEKVRSYLKSHPDINVVMGSWCNAAGHDHNKYIARMEKLIAEYPRITFVFMTGHPNGDGEIQSGNSAYQCYKIVTDHCRAKKRFCLDYWSIETHGMDGQYYPDANDNGESSGVNFYKKWMNTRRAGVDYFTTDACPHADQPITCNRIAYAAWWLWARIAGWEGK